MLAEHKAQVMEHGTTRLVLNRDQHPIRVRDFSRAAIKTCEGLISHGYKAYLVGGCIRDLLLGLKPKDFDIATNATPEKVKAIFSNSRIIGRRFKIVHVVYGNEIIEVTTFRSSKKIKRSGATVSDGQGMLVRDNTYGTKPSEDSTRRDFTINALYFDPADESIIDFHAGLHDLNHRLIEIIGDPKVRYAEDPVRMIRAVRFKAKLGFELSEQTRESILTMKELLTNISNARMFEEVNKLFLSGHGRASLSELIRYELLDLLLPNQSEIIHSQSFHDFVSYSLASSDERTQAGQRNKPYFLYAVLLFTKLHDRLKEQQISEESGAVDNIISGTAVQILSEQSTATDIPAAICEDIIELYLLYFKLFSPYLTQDDIDKITKRSYFRASFDLLKLRCRFDETLKPFVEFYAPYYEESSRLAKERNQKRQEKFQKRLQKTAETKRPAKGKKAGAQVPFEEDTAAEREARLAKARAWRIAMNLDP